jgi:hypothetical protein
VAGSEPRLGSGFLGGQLRKGGLHQPPFSFRPLLFLVVGRCGTSVSRGCVVEVVSIRGPDPLGPSGCFVVALRLISPCLPLAFCQTLRRGAKARPSRSAACLHPPCETAQHNPSKLSQAFGAKRISASEPLTKVLARSGTMEVGSWNCCPKK